MKSQCVPHSRASEADPPILLSTRRQVVSGISALALASAAASAAPSNSVTPEMFGAKGDGRTNDTQAFAAMSAHVTARGGGTIVLRRVTYIVGQQRPAEGGRKPSFAKVSVLAISNCARPVVIHGNGATLRLAPGLRYGRFDPASGNPLPDPEKREFGNEAMLPLGVIFINHCSDTVSIDNLELDGNLAELNIGGKSNRASWESGGSGIWLGANSGSEQLSKIHAHHFPADGIILKPAADRVGSTTVTDVISEYNGRQGCSITGGRNFVFQRCKFRHTGRAVIHHPPADGVDVEAEWPVRNVAFEECEFSDNFGFGVGAGRGPDGADVRFKSCKFIGTTNYALWPDIPGMRFSNCLIVGSMIHVRGDPDPAKAAQFVNCTFTDDPSLSPTRQVFTGREPQKTIAMMPNSQNVLFSRCHFRLVGEGKLPRSGPDVIYSNCDMSQRSRLPSSPLGTYIGTNTITGNAKLQGSVIRGKVILNGQLLQIGLRAPSHPPAA